MSGSRFLDLPPRTTKPRLAGLTHVLDKGAPLAEVEPLLGMSAPHIDIWKLGWGTAYLEPDPGAKVTLLAREDIKPCVGGTLLEAAWAQGKADECLAWAKEIGFPCVEVSNGAAGMPVAEKRELIAEAARRFPLVVSEVGSKDPRDPVSPEAWAEEMAGDLEAGAAWVLAEGRESGTVGLYEPDGSVRVAVVEAIEALGAVDRMVFEAPRKSQQAWFIRRLGPNVNLGNVPLGEVLGLEALRLGLRADTLDLGRGGGSEVALEARRWAT